MVEITVTGYDCDGEVIHEGMNRMFKLEKLPAFIRSLVESSPTIVRVTTDIALPTLEKGEQWEVTSVS